ncbi:MAG: hypothetical protein WKF59_00220 [Chitinophagaceae bacterium]
MELLIRNTLKQEADVRHYTRVGPKTIWANRIDLGFGYPRGNSYRITLHQTIFYRGNQ